MFSRTVSRSIALKSWGRTPIRFRISAWSDRLLTSYPRTSACPPVGFRRHSKISTVVVFPAPFGPRKANTSPFVRLNDMPFTATLSPYFFERPSTCTTMSDCPGRGAGRLLLIAAAFLAYDSQEARCDCCHCNLFGFRSSVSFHQISPRSSFLMALLLLMVGHVP